MTDEPANRPSRHGPRRDASEADAPVNTPAAVAALTTLTGWQMVDGRPTATVTESRTIELDTDPDGALVIRVVTPNLERVESEITARADLACLARLVGHVAEACSALPPGRVRPRVRPAALASNTGRKR